MITRNSQPQVPTESGDLSTAEDSQALLTRTHLAKRQKKERKNDPPYSTDSTREKYFAIGRTGEEQKINSSSISAIYTTPKPQ